MLCYNVSFVLNQNQRCLMATASKLPEFLLSDLYCISKTTVFNHISNICDVERIVVWEDA